MKKTPLPKEGGLSFLSRLKAWALPVSAIYANFLAEACPVPFGPVGKNGISGWPCAHLGNGMVLVNALVQVPYCGISFSSHSQNVFNSRWVKFGSRFSISIGGTSSGGHSATRTDGD